MKANKEVHLQLISEVKADLVITFILKYQILIPFIVSENDIRVRVASHRNLC